MKKIITLTLNPALDKSIIVDKLVPEKKLKAGGVKTEPGGGGVNVSRALHQLGQISQAYYLSGGYTGQQFDILLKQEGVDAIPVHIAGDTRENFIVLDKDTGKQFRFGLEGPGVSTTEWNEILQNIADAPADYIVASGSLAPGVPVDFFRELSALAKQKNAKLIVDTSGPALEAAVQEGLFLVKPNLGELASLINSKAELSADDAVEAGKELIATGNAQMVAVSMGAKGALLITAGQHYEIKPPDVKVQSTVGAGDSMVAGMLYALANDFATPDILAYGVAAGTAATLHPGTELCSKEDTGRLYNQIREQKNT